MSDADFDAVFRELRSILVPFGNELTVTADSDTAYVLDTPFSKRWKKELSFGKAEIGKRYVSFLTLFGTDARHGHDSRIPKRRGDRRAHRE